jgi:hypothetical protein
VKNLSLFFFGIGLLYLALVMGCAKKTIPESKETSLYAMSYYRGIDFPAEYVFISILNPEHEKITSIKFQNEPQSLIANRPSYGPQVEQNLTTWGISASKFMNMDSSKIKEELLRNITTNTVEIIYGDSTRQTLTIKEVPKFKYMEKHRTDTIPVTFW